MDPPKTTPQVNTQAVIWRQVNLPCSSEDSPKKRERMPCWGGETVGEFRNKGPSRWKSDDRDFGRHSWEGRASHAEGPAIGVWTENNNFVRTWPLSRGVRQETRASEQVRVMIIHQNILLEFSGTDGRGQNTAAGCKPKPENLGNSVSFKYSLCSP